MDLLREDITENILAIRLNHAYHDSLTSQELYDVTRGYWTVSLKNAQKADYAFCVYKGEIKEVYQIHGWFPAGTFPRPAIPNGAVPDGRFEFTGAVAGQDIRDKYVGKSIARLYKRGAANPIRYFFTDET